MARRAHRNPTFGAMIAAGFRRCDAAATTAQKGRALEDLLENIFRRVPGVDEVKRNVLNVFATEELDLAVGNVGHRNGLVNFPDVVLVECKNWSAAVGSQEVAYFITRLRQRGCQSGILVAMNGVTGEAAILTASRSLISGALAEKIRVIVLTRNDLAVLRSVPDFVTLIRRKTLELVATGTTI